jgi:prephenate dehydrogenase
VTGRRVAVIGLGLIGASLGGALRRGGDVVWGLDADSQAMRTALRHGFVDEVADDLATVVNDATLVILALPVLSIVELLPQIDTLSPPEAIIVDVGSVKAPVVRVMEQLPGASRAIGGHPIAGKERAGAAAAETSLFEGRSFALVPHATTSDLTLRTAETMVGALGAVPIVLSAVEHDSMVARTSHLPQLLSLALALTLDPRDELLAGPGLRDMTRLAASGPSMWNDIFMSNADNIAAALALCISHLQDLTRMAENGDAASLEHTMLRANERSAQIAGIVPS